MLRFLGSNGWAVVFILAALTEMGVFTEVVVEMMLTIADLWNFTEGTFSVDWPLGCASDKMGMEVSLAGTFFK